MTAPEHRDEKEQHSAEHSSTDRANPIAVERYLKGIKFPAKQGDLVTHAEHNEAPQEVLETLKRLKDKEYHTAADVAKEIGALE